MGTAATAGWPEILCGGGRGSISCTMRESTVDYLGIAGERLLAGGLL